MKLPTRQNLDVPRSAAPGMPGTSDDDLEIELIVKPPAPPIQSGTYLCRLDRITVWKRKEDGSLPDPTFFFEVVDPTEKTKAERNEPSAYGTEVRFNYAIDPPAEYAFRKTQADGFIAGMGYPASAWPEAPNNPGMRSLGGLFKKIRAECCPENKGSAPLFKVTVETKAGTGKNAGTPFTNIKKIERVPSVG